jgi:hypothetical protein
MKIIIFLLFTISIVEGGSLEEYIHKINPKLSNQTIKSIAFELKKYPKSITKIVKHESTFNPNAKSKNSIGLMGINHHVWLSSNPKYNLIKLGIIKHKNDLHTIHGNLKAGFFVWKQCKKNYRRYRGMA